MKKFLVVLMLIVSMVAFSEKVVVSMGDDIYSGTNHANPVVLVVLNKRTNKYTLYRNTASPHGPTWGIEVGYEINDNDLKLPILAFDSNHPEGYNTGLKSMVYLKHKGRIYKEIDHNTLIRILDDIMYEEYNY